MINTPEAVETIKSAGRALMEAVGTLLGFGTNSAGGNPTPGCRFQRRRESIAMKQLKLRNPYSASPKVLWLLETAFYVVVAGFCLQVAFLFLPTGEQFALGGQSNLSLVVILIFCVAFLIFLANCILWVGMLLFVLKYDGRKTTTKGLSVIVGRQLWSCNLLLVCIESISCSVSFVTKFLISCLRLCFRIVYLTSLPDR